MASYFWAEKFSSLGLLFNTKQGKQGLHCIEELRLFPGLSLCGKKWHFVHVELLLTALLFYIINEDWILIANLDLSLKFIV